MLNTDNRIDIFNNVMPWERHAATTELNLGSPKRPERARLISISDSDLVGGTIEHTPVSNNVEVGEV